MEMESEIIYLEDRIQRLEEQYRVLADKISFLESFTYRLPAELDQIKGYLSIDVDVSDYI